MSKRKQNFNISIVLAIIALVVTVTFGYNSNYIFSNGELEKGSNLKESDYVKADCKGIIEYRLSDGTRVDCLTDEYAIEYDWAKKWAESIGQSLYYAEMTGKKPAVAIIVKSPSDEKYIERIRKADKDITVFVIKAKDFQEYPLSAKIVK